MEFESPIHYRIIFWKGNLDDDRMLLHLKVEDDEFEPFEFHSAIVLTKDKSTLYACTTEGSHALTKHVKSMETKKWEFVENLPRMENDDSEVMLQLILDKHDKVLYGSIETSL